MLKRIALGLAAVGVTAGGYLLFIRPWQLRWGATEEEVAEAARAAAPQSARTVSVHLAIITAADGERTVVRSVTEPHFGLGGSVMSTAAPAAATVRLMARGELSATGALPPERCIEPPLMYPYVPLRRRSPATACDLRLE